MTYYPTNVDIRCRLDPGEIQGLGHWLQSRYVTDSHRPLFLIRKVGDRGSREVPFTDVILQNMKKAGEFSLPLTIYFEPRTQVEVLLCLEEHEPPREYLISGFPRSLNESDSPGRLQKYETKNFAI